MTEQEYKARLIAHKRSYLGLCPYRSGGDVERDKQTCVMCGWHPMVEEQRKAKLRAKRIKRWEKMIEEPYTAPVFTEGWH